MALLPVMEHELLPTMLEELEEEVGQRLQLRLHGHQLSRSLLLLGIQHVHVLEPHSTGRGCDLFSVGSVSASHTVGREFTSRPGHTKDHHKNGTNCLPA